MQQTDVLDQRPGGCVLLRDPASLLTLRGPAVLYYRITDGVAHELGDHVRALSGCVQDVMTPTVVSIAGDATVVEAGARMLALGIHRLMVVHRADELVGVVTTLDLLRAFVHANDP